jgi:glycosyltransferase involved in cell wall biosynthesis
MDTSVSVVITTFNKAQYLEQAVTSVLAQTFPDIECIVIDDGSTDDTCTIAQSLVESHPTVKYIYKENGGVSSARNCGADLAHGEWIQFLDADDWIHPDKIRFQLSFAPSLRQNAVIYSDYKRVYVSRVGHVTKTQPQIIGALSKENLVSRLLVCPDFLASSPFPLLQQAMLIRRDLLCHKKFDPQLSACEDREFVLDLLMQDVPFLYAPMISAYYRKHHANLTDNDLLMRQSYVKYFQLVCDRYPILMADCQTSITFLIEKSLEENNYSHLAELSALAQFPMPLFQGRFIVHSLFMLNVLYRLRSILPNVLLYERYRGPRLRKLFSLLVWPTRLLKFKRTNSLTR